MEIVSTFFNSLTEAVTGT